MYADATVIGYGSLNENDPCGPDTWLLGPQLMELLRKVEELWPCWRTSVTEEWALRFQKLIQGLVAVSACIVHLWFPP